MATQAVTLRFLSGLQDYTKVWDCMKQFTAWRGSATNDEIWLLQHPPVFTQGQAGKSEHILNAHQIPVVPIDRGGQVTYHGPGQLVVYLLLDAHRLNLGARALVSCIENCVIRLLQSYGVAANADPDAPGVYIGNAKIAALGIRVRKPGTYHGLSLNVDMDLQPFNYINPCGYAGQAVTQLRDELSDASLARIGDVATRLSTELIADLGYTEQSFETSLPELAL